MAQEADRLKFALAEIDRVDPTLGEDEALVAEIRRLSELDAVREAAAGARASLSGSDDTNADEANTENRSAIALLVRAAAMLESSGDTDLGALGGRLSEVLTVLGDVDGELGGFLADLPTDASALETRLSRQAELRSLTRKYAADVDGVLRWAAQSRESLAQLDVSEEALATLSRRVADLAGQVVGAAAELTALRTRAADGLARAVTEELSGLAMSDAD